MYKKTLLLASFFLATILMSFSTGPSIVPLPARMKPGKGTFRVDRNTSILVSARDADLKHIAQFLAEQFRYAGGPELKMNELTAANSKARAIVFAYAKGKSKIPAEGYVLNVTPERILVEGSTPAGVFYGLQSLLQLLPAEICKPSLPDTGRTWEIPCTSISDHPRYPYRGMHLDVSRHFFPKEFIKKYISLIATYKMNTFHWHLTDDNGWRIEIKKYPKLTEVGAWRVDRENLPWSQRPAQKAGEQATYGGFYSQDDIREIVAFARARYVNIIPEIEMPAHSVAALAAYPQFSCTGGPFTVVPGSYWPDTSIYCAGNDSTFTFLEDVLTEVMDLFPSEYIHVGGDEADKTEWGKCPRCQARMKAEGLKNTDELQSYFMKRIEKFIASKGRKMIGWDEILEGGLAPQATVMSWRGLEGGIAAARQGHDALMTPTSFCYFDYYQGDPVSEPKASGGYVTLKHVYSYEPTPAGLTKEEAKHILGAQGNVWTEYIPTPGQAEYMAVPRMIALAEVDWSPASARDWNSFQVRMQDQFKRLGYLDVNYSRGSFKIDLSDRYDKKAHMLMISMGSEQLNIPIRYTLDGNDPTMKSPVYAGPFGVEKNCYLKAGLFADGKPVGGFTSMQVIYHNAVPGKIKYFQPYSERYPASGHDALINGFRGSVNHRDGQWQGFLGNNLEVIIDLGKMQTVNSVSVTCLLNPKSWIFLPEFVEFSLSPDGKHWHSINEYYNPAGQRADEPVIQPFSHAFPPTEARYVRVIGKSIGVCPDWHVGKGQKCWIFADEIVVF
jgi:hexosaminidase